MKITTSIRYYPDSEKNTDSQGKPYPDQPQDTTRPELDAFIKKMKDICHTEGYGLIITSLNHGQHTTGSMHFKGLAMDYNLCKIDPTIGRMTREWLSFDEQAAIAAEVAKALGISIWIFPNDLGTHTHVSVHPA